MTTLKYQSLMQAREIRLIDILPGNASDIVRVRLYHSILSLGNPPHFEALSYVWGSTDSPATIEVEVAISTDSAAYSANFAAAQNLATALRYLRFLDRPRTVWADALCINQADYAERAQQIQIMGDIYRLASRVIAFLGPERDDSTYALDTLEHVAAMVEVDFAIGDVKPSLAGTSEPHWADMQHPPPFGRRELLAMYYLIHREWFDRLWIRQEIGLGYLSAVLLCGNKQTSWQHFSRAIFTLMRKPITHEGLNGIFDAVQMRDFGDRLGRVDTVALYSIRGFRLTNLRRQIAGARCSDERDRIYGVLGLLREPYHDIGIIPDYTRTVAEVYSDAARKQIVRSGELILLSQCELRENSRFSELPSWVPDWSTEMLSSGVHAVLPPLLVGLPAFERIDNHLLRAWGIRCGIVSRVIPMDEKLSDRGSSLHDICLEIRRVFHDAYKGVVARRSYDNFLEAFTRALWLNDFADRWYPPSSHRPPFEDCLALTAAVVGDWSDHVKLPTLPFSDPVTVRYLDSVRDACRTRALLLTSDGYVGLAPGMTVIGDELVLLFGCHKPLVVRLAITKLSYSQSSNPTSPISHKQCRLVGECFIDGMMDGEIILGDLPHNVRSQMNADGLTSNPSGRYIDTKTKAVSEKDPRTEPFLVKLAEKGVLGLPTVDCLEKNGKMKVLMGAGYNVQTFDLV